MKWRWAAASAIGTSHIRTGTKLQDAFAVAMMESDHLFAVVSDGAGSAAFGRYGAWLACRTLKVRFREWFATNPHLPDDDKLLGWIDDVRDTISAVAEARSSAPRAFAATLAVLVWSPAEVLALHIGDTAIVARKNSGWEVICRPENGEYASSTYFITDDPQPRLNLIRYPSEFDAFALFSDGVGDIALRFSDFAAHPEFFDPMMRPIDASDSSGRLPDLSDKLRDFLSSERVCERTDDDKTLLLLSGA